MVITDDGTRYGPDLAERERLRARAGILQVLGWSGIACGLLLLAFGGRSAMLIVCSDGPFACTDQDVARYAFGPVGALIALGLTLLVFSVADFRRARRRG